MPKVAKKSDIVLPCGTEMEKVQFVAPLILYGYRGLMIRPCSPS